MGGDTFGLDVFGPFRGVLLNFLVKFEGGDGLGLLVEAQEVLDALDSVLEEVALVFHI